MRILVSDSSILLEMAKRGLLEAMFRLPFEFAVPDVLFEEELIDLGAYSRDDLRRYGLRVEELDAIGVTTALSYQARRRRLSLVDCFALALSSIKGYPLLRAWDGITESARKESGLPQKRTKRIVMAM